MSLKVKTPPTIEPISLADALLHLRADSATLADSISASQSIVPGAHIIAATFGLEGVAVDVLGYDALIILNAGACGAGGSVACKLQHRDSLTASWVDVTSGTFTTVTEANDNATAELAYTGGKRYIRPVCTVAGATCDFSVDVLKYAGSVADSALISSKIKAARLHYESIYGESYITQTFEQTLDAWPDEDIIKLAVRPLQSVTSIKYYDFDDVEYTLAITEYQVDTYSHKPRISLRYGKQWPSEVLRPINGIIVEYIAGYGDTSASVPDDIRSGLLLAIGHLYKNREDSTEKVLSSIPLGASALLGANRLFHF